MQVSVRLSAGLAQDIGLPRLFISLPDGATVADLVAVLRSDHPRAERLSVALPIIGGQYVSLDSPLAPGQEVALLLPVAGGSGAAGG